jgi:hypothetical protein
MQPAPPTQFQALRLLYVSLISGIIAFTLVSLYIVSRKKLEPIVLSDMKQIVAIGVIAASALLTFLAFYVFNKKIKNIDTPDPKSKMEKYRAASIIRWAMLEVPVMLSIIVYMLSADELYLMLSALLLGIFISVRPSKRSIIKDLGISEDDLERA